MFPPHQICPPPACAHIHTHHPPPCSPRLPLLLCSACARGSHAHSHTRRRQREERGEAGAAAALSPVGWEVRTAGPRSRYGIPHQREEGDAAARRGLRSLYPRSVINPTGKRIEGRVNCPSASQLTASKQPFLKANCNLSEPPARSNAPRPFGSVPPPVPQRLRRGGHRPGLAGDAGRAADAPALRPERGRCSRENRTPAAHTPLPPLRPATATCAPSFRTQRSRPHLKQKNKPHAGGDDRAPGPPAAPAGGALQPPAARGPCERGGGR